MKKNVAMLLGVLFCGLAAAYSQKVHSTMFVRVVNAEPADSLGAVFYPYKLKITQDFDVSGLKKDTLHLKLENTGFFQSLRAKGDLNFALIPNMNVSAKFEGEEYHDANYSFDGVSIIIPEHKHPKIRVEYGYYSDLCFRTEIGIYACGLLQYDFGWNSWYFKVEDEPIKFDKVCFATPDTAYYFVNCTSSVEPDGTIALDLEQQRYNDLSFHLAVKKWYDSYVLEEGEVKCNLLLSKRDSISNENEISVPLSHLPNSYIAKRKEQTRQMLSSLNRIFPESDAKDLTILEDDLRAHGGKYGYGRAIHTSKGAHAVFVDRSFWDSPSLAHELVHCYLDYNYDRIADRYFFDESLIEYFANYVYYSDNNERDKAFEEKITYFSNLPEDKATSIFEIQRNYVNTESGGGTWGVVYYKVPYQIHLFAKKIGEDRFIAAVRSFNLLIKQGGCPGFDDFGRILQNLGVSEDEWGQFRSSL